MHITSAGADISAQIAVIERQAAANVQALHRISTRTSRVLAATSAFSMLTVEARSLSQVVRTLVTLARASEDSLDHDYIERELSHLCEQLRVLEQRHAKELAQAAVPARKRSREQRKPWWQIWK
jgi:hypothetical protein